MQPVFDEYRGEELKPGNNVNIDDDDELDKWIRETSETLYHPVGTCKMGIDNLSVTNEHGHVRLLLINYLYPFYMFQLGDRVFR